MNSAILERLSELGQHLDADLYPRVFNDGIVALSDPGVDVSKLGAATCDEYEGKSGPAAGSWQGATGWQGAAHRPWSSGHAEPSRGRLLRENYLGQLSAVFAAYPRTEYWLRDEGMWLSVESAVLPGLDRSATFLISIPFRPLCPVRSWAFWNHFIGFEWIGPRHTNAVDGSICAFNPSEGTWKNGGSIVELIDQYTMWALRQLHLEKLCWWPGHQTAQFIYERLTELNDNEWCGCSPNASRYSACCKQADLAADKFRAAIEFVGGFLRFKPRQPPASVMRFLWNRSDPPAFQKVNADPMLFLGSCLFPPRNGTAPSKVAGRIVMSSVST
jgi:hypothetical protein